MRIIFFGSPEEAAESLQSLVSTSHDIVAVYTQPDRRAGRGRTKRPTPVKVFAEQNGLSVITPASLRNNPDEFERMTSVKADVFVVVAYGRILPIEVLGIPPMGVVNIHPSLLPKFRGPSPVVSAILSGEAATGVTVMMLDEGMDTGPILAQSSPVQLSGRERTASLQSELFREGAGMLPAVLQGLQDGSVIPNQQNDALATTTSLLDRSDGEIDWSKSADYIDRMVRAYDQWPGAFTTMNGNGLKILEVEPLGPSEREAEPAKPGVIVVDDGRLLIGTGDGT